MPKNQTKLALGINQNPHLMGAKRFALHPRGMAEGRVRFNLINRTHKGSKQ